MNPYHFKMSGKTVIMRHAHGKNIRASPNGTYADGNGGQGGWAQWTVQLLGAHYCKLRNNKTGKYLRIARKASVIDCDGGGGQFTKFKIHVVAHPNGVKLESDVFPGKYVAVTRQCQMKIGGGGQHCLIQFYKFGGAQVVVQQPVVVIQQPIQPQVVYQQPIQPQVIYQPPIQPVIIQQPDQVAQLQAQIESLKLQQQLEAQKQQQAALLLQQQQQAELARQQQEAALYAQQQQQAALLAQQQQAALVAQQQQAAFLAQQQAAAQQQVIYTQPAVIVQQPVQQVIIQQGPAKYHFAKDNTVLVKSKHGRNLRVSPNRMKRADGNGGQGQWARWKIKLEGGNKVRLQSEKTGQFIRIRKNGDVDVDGHGGGMCVFKVHTIVHPNVVRLESKKNNGWFLAIQNDGTVRKGGGGQHCQLTFFRA